MNWKKAKIFDFTQTLANGAKHAEFDSSVIGALRQPTDTKLAIILDYGDGFKKAAPYLVSDHLNLSGNNPLSGANDPIGERFPVVNGIYVDSFAKPLLPGIEKGIAANVRNGLQPTDQELQFMYSVGADFYCYNVVPTMLVAAHAGYKVLALVGAKGTHDWQQKAVDAAFSIA